MRHKAAFSNFRGRMKIFLICSVRCVSAETAIKQVEYVKSLESIGYTVHYPPRDTNQSASGLEICRENFNAMFRCDEVHVFYEPGSQGTHFDMGMAFALNRRVVAVNVGELPPGKSFARMLIEWEACRVVR